MSRQRVEYITTVVRFAPLVALAAILVVAVPFVPVSASCSGTFSLAHDPLTTPAAITDAVARAESVFRGRLLRRENTRRTLSFNEERVTFVVETVWKGNVQSEQSVLTNECRNAPTLFTADGTYIVYVGRFGSDIGAMNHSKRITGPVEEDAVLGPGTPPSAPTASRTEVAIPGTMPPRRANIDATPLLIAAGIGCVGVFTFLLARQQLADNRRARTAADR